MLKIFELLDIQKNLFDKKEYSYQKIEPLFNYL